MTVLKDHLAKRTSKRIRFLCRKGMLRDGGDALRMVLTSLHRKISKKEEYFAECENCIKFKFHRQ